MPTTKFVDDSLSFLPAQHQWTYYPGLFPTTFYPGVASSNGGSSSESEFSAPDSLRESSNSPVRSPDTTTREDASGGGGPFLQLVEPPIDSIRFRYPTEMKGTHGSIKGKNARTFPSVKLVNYNPSTPNEKIIIRCSLTTSDVNESDRIQHVHQLKGKGKTPASPLETVDVDDPFDIVVSSPNYQAVFGNMSILFIKKEDQVKELLKKKKRHFIKRFINPLQIPEGLFDEKKVMQEVREDVKNMNSVRLNTACLRFEALRGVSGRLEYEAICPPIYSDPINNLKNPQFNELRICRIDKVAGKCLGNEEVFIFVEKVNKKDIKVRFFELNESKEEVWEAYAKFGEDDVHYQYAIAFRTPRYRNIEINDNVKVYFQLERPSNESRSTPKEFEYTPDTKHWQDLIRKRPRRESPPIPVSVNDFSRPSTSASTTSSWDSQGLAGVGNTFNPHLVQSLTTSSSDTGVSNTGYTPTIMDFDYIFPDLLSALEPHVPGDISLFEDLNMELGDNLNPPSTHSSINLSSFSSGDSEKISQMISNTDALEKWARFNGYSTDLMQQVQSEVMKESEGCHQHRPDNNYVTDGATGKFGMAIRDAIYPEMEHYRIEHQGPRSPVLRTNVFHQMAMDQGPRSPVDRVVPQMAMDQEPCTAIGNQNHWDKQNSKKLTKENIVLNVNTILDGLLKLKKIGKIQDKRLKYYLLLIFNTCVGEDDDRVLHVLASKEKFHTEVLVFLNVLKTHHVVEKVINLKNNRGQTALHIAAEKGSLQTISQLVDNGADVNVRDIRLNTPVHLVANRRLGDGLHAVSHLIEKNVDLSIYNDEGLTALHVFVLKRKSDIISTLIIKQEYNNSTIDLINQPDRKQGNTALHFAVQKRFTEVVRLLLYFDSQINVNAKNFDDKTPLAYVSGEGDSEALQIEELLLTNDADPSLVSFRKKKMSKEPEELKDEFEINNISNQMDNEDVDESLPSYGQEWKSESELKLMDAKTICSVCPVLDDNKNWVKLLKKLDFDEDTLLPLELKWSPSLYLLKAVAETMPHVTPEILRDTLIRINPECKKAAQFIDDMILHNMGVF